MSLYEYQSEVNFCGGGSTQDLDPDQYLVQQILQLYEG